MRYSYWNILWLLCLAWLVLLFYVAAHPITAPCDEFLAKRSFCQP